MSILTYFVFFAGSMVIMVNKYIRPDEIILYFIQSKERRKNQTNLLCKFRHQGFLKNQTQQK